MSASVMEKNCFFLFIFLLILANSFSIHSGEQGSGFFLSFFFSLKMGALHHVIHSIGVAQSILPSGQAVDGCYQLKTVINSLEHTLWIFGGGLFSGPGMTQFHAVAIMV